ncbi:MAG: hypothetical protein PHQ52_02020 [Candidatus Omnitrophica bacterium]|nr:hypothetical protein [Candidatus Omnitrophota bacterium]
MCLYFFGYLKINKFCYKILTFCYLDDILSVILAVCFILLRLTIITALIVTTIGKGHTQR